jgi:uroporphyrinogen decarboxylase
MFDQVLDYPVSVLQWHIWQTGPSLEEAANKTDKAFMGGIVRELLVDGTEEEIEKQIKDTIAMTKGRRIIISPGCAVKLDYKENLLRHMRNLVNQLSP